MATHQRFGDSSGLNTATLLPPSALTALSNHSASSHPSLPFSQPIPALANGTPMSLLYALAAHRLAASAASAATAPTSATTDITPVSPNHPVHPRADFIRLAGAADQTALSLWPAQGGLGTASRTDGSLVTPQPSFLRRDARTALHSVADSSAPAAAATAAVATSATIPAASSNPPVFPLFKKPRTDYSCSAGPAALEARLRFPAEAAARGDPHGAQPRSIGQNEDDGGYGAAAGAPQQQYYHRREEQQQQLLLLLQQQQQQPALALFLAAARSELPEHSSSSSCSPHEKDLRPPGGLLPQALPQITSVTRQTLEDRLKEPVGCPPASARNAPEDRRCGELIRDSAVTATSSSSTPVLPPPPCCSWSCNYFSVPCRRRHRSLNALMAEAVEKSALKSAASRDGEAADGCLGAPPAGIALVSSAKRAREESEDNFSQPEPALSSRSSGRGGGLDLSFLKEERPAGCHFDLNLDLNL